MYENKTIGCGTPGDYGHRLFDALRGEVDLLNTYIGILRTEGWPCPGLHNAVNRAQLGNNSARFHVSLLSFDGRHDTAEPVSINERRFWAEYEATEDGQRAKAHASAGTGVWGRFVDSESDSGL